MLQLLYIRQMKNEEFGAPRMENKLEARDEESFHCELYNVLSYSSSAMLEMEIEQVNDLLPVRLICIQLIH